MRVDRANAHKHGVTRRVFSPPPCGEGLGVGVGVPRHCARVALTPPLSRKRERERAVLAASSSPSWAILR